MHKDMQGLWELQQIDSAIGELEADLRGLDDGSALQAELAAAESKLAEREAAHKKDATAQKDLEADLEAAETKRKASMDKAYGGTISNPKELESLEQNIEALGRQTERYETQLLTLFDEVDEEGQAAAEQAATVERLRRTLAETIATHKSKTARISEQVAALREERASATEAVDATSLAKYERVLKKPGNVGVAAVSDGMCSCCRVNLPVIQLTRVQTGDQLEQCESCLRILWVAGD